MTAVIDAHELAIGWNGHPIAEHITFAVEPGEIFGILGRSAAGKSTLLRVLIGLDRPIAGDLRVLGAPPLLRDVRPRYGVMFQQGALFGSITVGDNVALPLETWTDLPKDAIRGIVRTKLGLVGLADAIDLPPRALSGGMRKRAALARALALEPPLVFLDEPHSGLDPITSREIDELIYTLARTLGLTVVLVTHQLSTIRTIVDRCMLLDRDHNGIVAIGSPRELANSAHPTVHAFFAGGDG